VSRIFFHQRYVRFTEVKSPDSSVGWCFLMAQPRTCRDQAFDLGQCLRLEANWGDEYAVYKYMYIYIYMYLYIYIHMRSIYTNLLYMQEFLFQIKLWDVDFWIQGLPTKSPWIIGLCKQLESIFPQLLDLRFSTAKTTAEMAISMFSWSLRLSSLLINIACISFGLLNIYIYTVCSTVHYIDWKVNSL